VKSTIGSARENGSTGLKRNATETTLEANNTQLTFCEDSSMPTAVADRGNGWWVAKL